MTIWKFDVMPDAFTLRMPQGAKLLSVHVQSAPPGPVADATPAMRAWRSVAETPRMWALVDSNAPLVERKLVVFGTGQPLPLRVSGVPVSDLAFVGTFILFGGSFVGHLFDAGEEE